MRVHYDNEVDAVYIKKILFYELEDKLILKTA